MKNLMYKKLSIIVKKFNSFRKINIIKDSYIKNKFLRKKKKSLKFKKININIYKTKKNTKNIINKKSIQNINKYLIFNKQYILKLFKLKKSSQLNKIVINITPNNIFCTISKDTKKTIASFTKALIWTNITKKSLKHYFKKMILFFFKKVFNKLKKKIIIKLIIPKFLKKKILRELKRYFKQTNKKILINLKSKKCFNGCKSPKNRRKKRMFNVIYKK